MSTCREVDFVAVEKPTKAFTNILFSSGTTGRLQFIQSYSNYFLVAILQWKGIFKKEISRPISSICICATQQIENCASVYFCKMFDTVSMTLLYKFSLSHWFISPPYTCPIFCSLSTYPTTHFSTCATVTTISLTWNHIWHWMRFLWKLLVAILRYVN